MDSAAARVRPARSEDLASAEGLLREAGLPLDGFRDQLAHTLVASEDDRIVGCVALELYGEFGLLRSLAVSPERRGRLLGERLTAEAVDLAKARGIRDLYLLTETAVGFFPRFGFSAEDRALAPNALKESVEFKSACPASAVMMRLKVGGR
jgi:N-acetylglutamate synthase-like GNAT family acetyltransferase